MSGESFLDPVPIDVGGIVRRTVASLYSHLVTRPTGRAVRLAIESQVSGTGARTLSLVDLSQVRILDFSCADEVVAKLLVRFMERGPPPEAFFVFRGVGEAHRAPIETVLDRRSLAAVAETGAGRFELVGTATDRERQIWGEVEKAGTLTGDQVGELFGRDGRNVLSGLVGRGLILGLPDRGEFRALSTLVPRAGA